MSEKARSKRWAMFWLLAGAGGIASGILLPFETHWLNIIIAALQGGIIIDSLDVLGGDK
jgi:fumarate reductase subunit D